MSDVTTIEADVPERYADAVSTRLQRAADEDVVGRIWRKDGTLWAPEGTPEVTNRLGWLDIADREREKLATYEAFAEGLRAEGYRDAVVLGMGGSSLAPEVFRQSFGKLDPGLTLHVLDSTHPQQVREVLNSIDLDRALMIVSSKSGGTIEPMSMFKAFHARQGDGSHFAAVTDPGSSLEELAGKHGFRQVFHGDPDIGGRYSALSARSGSSRPPPRASTSQASWTPRSAPPRSAASSTATPACGSAARSASSPARAATSSRSSPTRR